MLVESSSASASASAASASASASASALAAAAKAIDVKSDKVPVLRKIIEMFSPGSEGYTFEKGLSAYRDQSLSFRLDIKCIYDLLRADFKIDTILNGPLTPDQMAVCNNLKYLAAIVLQSQNFRDSGLDIKVSMKDLIGLEKDYQRLYEICENVEFQAVDDDVLSQSKKHHKNYGLSTQEYTRDKGRTSDVSLLDWCGLDLGVDVVDKKAKDYFDTRQVQQAFSKWTDSVELAHSQGEQAEIKFAAKQSQLLQQAFSKWAELVELAQAEATAVQQAKTHYMSKQTQQAFSKW
ncbi:MAG: hypothetical protein VW378_07465, partial [bacterium]